MIKRLFRKAADKLTGKVPMQTLLDNGHIKMQKTAEVEADDYDNKISFWYRFTFDNEGRKRKFLQAITNYPEQDWDKFVDWFDDFSNLNGEVCVEAKFLVPPEEVKRTRHRFQHFITEELRVGS